MVDIYGAPATLPHHHPFSPPPDFKPTASTSASSLAVPSSSKARIPAFASSRPTFESFPPGPAPATWGGTVGGGAAYQPHASSQAAGLSSFAPQVAAFAAGASCSPGAAGVGALKGPPTANKKIPAFGAKPPTASLSPATEGAALPADEAQKTQVRRKSGLLDHILTTNADDVAVPPPSFASAVGPSSRSPSPRSASPSHQTAAPAQHAPCVPSSQPPTSNSGSSAHTDAAQMLCHLAAQSTPSSTTAPLPPLHPPPPAQGYPHTAPPYPSHLSASSSYPSYPSVAAPLPPQPSPPPLAQSQHVAQVASPPESSGSWGDAAEGSGDKGKKELKQTKRAAQNRAAQRAFRERKQQQIRDLEELAARLPTLERDLSYAQSLIAQLQAEKGGWEREREALRGEVEALRGIVAIGKEKERERERGQKRARYYGEGEEGEGEGEEKVKRIREVD
ncbi:hypothetical protein JCM11251_003280 [Rhodosporidiobolus azoricus]